MFLLWHPSLTAINLAYTFPILETSATALCGTTGKYMYFPVLEVYTHWCEQTFVLGFLCLKRAEENCIQPSFFGRFAEDQQYEDEICQSMVVLNATYVGWFPGKKNMWNHHWPPTNQKNAHDPPTFQPLGCCVKVELGGFKKIPIILE